MVEGQGGRGGDESISRGFRVSAGLILVLHGLEILGMVILMF